MATLVLLRHGSTVWGNENRFAGWGDTPLSEAGMEEARRAAALLRGKRPKPDLLFTSRLLRARQTAEIIAEAIGIDESRTHRDWRLNERHYGALQGESRDAMVERFGNDLVGLWRRSFEARPPEMPLDDPRWQEQVERLPEIPLELHPRTESMAEGAARALPVWTESIVPALRSGKNVLVVAHTSPIRGIITAIEGLNDDESAALRFATAIPKRYVFDRNFTAVESRYLLKGISERLRHRSKQRKPR